VSLFGTTSTLASNVGRRDRHVDPFFFDPVRVADAERTELPYSTVISSAFEK
jgi:hypothetical protein